MWPSLSHQLPAPHHSACGLATAAGLHTLQRQPPHLVSPREQASLHSGGSPIKLWVSELPQP